MTKTLVDVDTAALPDVLGRKLRDLASAARVFELPDELSPAPSHPDAFGYGLMITDDTGKSKTISFGLPEAPALIRDLVNALRDASAAGKP